MMTSLSSISALAPEQRAAYGVDRAKTIAFEAIHNLWRRRKAEGRSQAELAKVLNKDEGWISRSLKGPGNWTIKTLGELVEALDGDLEIVVHAMEDPVSDLSNYTAYSGYEPSERLIDYDDIKKGNSATAELATYQVMRRG
jgi:transcriptional regulator with XRE-family HTH domain